MGIPDRLREEGKSEEEIMKIISEGKVVSKDQDPATARVTVDSEESELEPYMPPPPGDGVENEYYNETTETIDAEVKTVKSSRFKK